MEHPDNERCFEIVHSIINGGFSDMMVLYKETLQNLRYNRKDSVVPASVAIGMIGLGKNDSDFLALIKSFENKTRVAKALEIKLKKQ